MEENHIPRSKLLKQITVTIQERNRLVKVGKKLGAQIKDLISIVTYGSFLRWVRLCGPVAAAKKGSARKPGCPRTPDEIREFILRLDRENSWGYTRILGELRKLGIKLSRQTVKNILKEHGLDPSPERGKGTWDEFLASHAATLWQCDFATKPMWTIRGFIDLYFLVFVHVGTRRCWISPCTQHPESAWCCQQARNFLMHAEDVELTPKIVMRDNDAKYTQQFDGMFEVSDARVMRNSLESPNLRAYVERLIQTLQVDCLDRFMVVSESHLNLINRELQSWYNQRYRRLLAALRVARKTAGLTQTQVAKKFRTHASFVSKTESGERRIDVIELEESCRLYGVTITDFLKALAPE